MTPVERYAQVILHSGCSIPLRKHKWNECAAKGFFLKIARKHQHKLQSNGMTVGYWITEEKLAKILSAEIHIDSEHGFPEGYTAKDLAGAIVKAMLP